MFTPRTAWGLDVGESSVKAVKIRRTKVGAEILAFDMVERAWPSEESGDRDYHLRAAVSALAERNSFGRTPIVVSIPEPAFSRFIPLPPVDKRRIPEVVRYEARQQIPFPIEEVVWDYQPVHKATEPGEETEVAIFSLRSQFVYALLANLSLSKVRPAAVLPVPLALYNYLTFDRDVAKGTIVVDLGAGSTDILICDPENFRVRNITVSGNGITRALAERLKISPAEAEKLKRESKDKVQAARLFKLVQPVLTDLVGQVQRTIGFFKSQIHNVRIEQALLLGNTFRLPGATEFFVGQLGCDVMSSDVLERITLAPSVDGAALKEALPSLSVALGLALQGVGLGRVQVNLMPREMLFRQEVARKRPFAAAAAGCLALILGARLLALKSEDAQLKEDLQKQKDVRTTLDAVKRTESEYSTALNMRNTAEQKLVPPTRLSAGEPAFIGYRGCINATNEINKVLSSMSPEIAISRIHVAPARYRFTSEQLGGRSGGELPAMKLSMSGVSTKTIDGGKGDAAFLENQLVNAIKSAVTKMADGKERPVFVIPGSYELQDVRGGLVFTVDCYVWIGD